MNVPTTTLKDPSSGRIVTVNTRDLVDENLVLNQKYMNWQRVSESHQESVEVKTTSDSQPKNPQSQNPEPDKVDEIDLEELEKKIKSLPKKESIVAFAKEKFDADLDIEQTRAELEKACLDLASPEPENSNESDG